MESVLLDSLQTILLSVVIQGAVAYLNINTSRPSQLSADIRPCGWLGGCNCRGAGSSQFRQGLIHWVERPEVQRASAGTGATSPSVSTFTERLLGARHCVPEPWRPETGELSCPKLIQQRSV